MMIFLTKLFISSHTFLKITTKSGFLQSTISIMKNDFCFLNIVFEKIKPIVRAIIALNNINPIMPIHPKVAPIIRLQINE